MNIQAFRRFGTKSLLLLLAITSVFLALVLASTRAEAAKTPGCHYDYFEDPSYCILAGHRSYDCEGNLISSWGAVTSYVLGDCYCDP